MMFHAREPWAVAAGVSPRSFGAAVPVRISRFSLVVDLGQDLFSAKWWRGLATLGLLCSAAAAAAPGFEPLSGGTKAMLPDRDRFQAEALGIQPLGNGSATGLRMTPTEAVAPARDRGTPSRELVVRFDRALRDRFGGAVAAPLPGTSRDDGSRPLGVRLGDLPSRDVGGGRRAAARPPRRVPPRAGIRGRAGDVGSPEGRARGTVRRRSHGPSHRRPVTAVVDAAEGRKRNERG